jgi:hypothetical protein
MKWDPEFEGLFATGNQTPGKPMLVVDSSQ